MLWKQETKVSITNPLFSEPLHVSKLSITNTLFSEVSKLSR